MLNLGKMIACTPAQAIPMARHMCDPTAGRELAEELAPYGVEGPALGSHSVARLRPDLDPRLATLLEIDDGWDDVGAIAALLAGRTARGAGIAGIEHAPPQRSLVEALGLQAGRLPTRAEIAHVAAGLRADGDTPLPSLAPARRLFRLYGLKEDRIPDEAEQANMANGRRSNGDELKRGVVGELSRRPGSGISALLLSIDAPKSLSVGVALAPGAERAILLNAHRAAASRTMDEVDRLIGHVRRGDGGRFERPASTCWISLTHFTARPTYADRVTGIGGLAAGDPHVHEQVLLLTAALADDGRPGKIDTGALQHHVKTLGATYQMLLAGELRLAGVAVSLHPDQDCARLDHVPEELVRLFSKRTVQGAEKASVYAARQGLDFDAAEWPLSTALIKRAVQGDPLAPRRDDVGDLASWHAQTAAIGSRLPSLVASDAATRAKRRETSVDAHAIAASRLAAVASKRFMSNRTAAALALIEVADATPSDIDRIAASLPPFKEEEAGQVCATRPLDGAAVWMKAADGSAVLVEGGREAVVAAAADMWIARRSPHGFAMPVQVARKQDVRDVEDEVRKRLRERGAIGPDVKIVRTPDGDGGCRTIPLAPGETIVFTANVNGVVGGKGGRVGSAGSTVLVNAIDEAGVTVTTAKGSAAVIKWPSLFDPASKTMTVAYGYAALWPCRADDASVAAIMEGSAHASRLGLPSTATILFDRDAELVAEAPMVRQSELDRRLEEGRLWKAIAERLARRAREPVVERLEEVRREAIRLRLTVTLKAERGTYAADVAGPARRRFVARGLARIEPALRARSRAFAGLSSAMTAQPVGAVPLRPSRIDGEAEAVGGKNAASTYQPGDPEALSRSLEANRGQAEARSIGQRAVRVSKPLPEIGATTPVTPMGLEEDDDAVLATVPSASASSIDRVTRLRSAIDVVRRSSVRAALKDLLVSLEAVLAATSRVLDKAVGRGASVTPLTEAQERMASARKPARPQAGLRKDTERSDDGGQPHGRLVRRAADGESNGTGAVHTYEQPTGVSTSALAIGEPASALRPAAARWTVPNDTARKMVARLKHAKRFSTVSPTLAAIAKTLEERGGAMQCLTSPRSASPSRSRRPTARARSKDDRGL